ncbi:hypothetical protein VTN00DRAFT_2572 [Thermoascus crustaceus]|uniref:uncharacterized protein n=1 Tax=Thermoascus crustaceus TaxID=5088 RepID=UPI003743EA7F
MPSTTTFRFDDQTEDPAPSYEESVSSSQVGIDHHDLKQIGGVPSSPPPPLPLQRHLADVRTQRIGSILTTYIGPLLLSHGASGLYKTTCVLIPSNVDTLQSRTSDSSSVRKEPKVVGFPLNDVVNLVQLKGEEHTLEFWSQPAVVKELEVCLKARLAATGHTLEGTGQDPSATGANSPSEGHIKDTRSPDNAKKSFWGRTKAKYFYRPAGSETGIIDRKLGWRAEDEDGQNGKLPVGEVRVQVQWREVCLRMETETGLYDNKKGPGLCITIEVGS